MAVRKGYIDPATIKAGPQQPQKYKQTGPNYAQYGEVYGYVYNPIDDQYYKDKKAYEDFLVTSGQIEKPKGSPSLLDTVAPVAALGGAYALSEGIGEGLTKEGGFLSGVGDKIGGLLGMGGKEAATQTTEAASNLTGLQGLGATEIAGPPMPSIANGGLAGPVAPEAAGVFDISGIGAGGNLILPAVGALGAYNLATEDVSEGRGLLQGAASGAAIGSYFNPATGGLPVGTLVGAGVGGLLGLGKSMFGQHESTRDATAKKTNELLKKSNDPTYQSYVQGMREQYKTAPKGPAYAGMFNTFDEYKKAGLQANDLTGVYGNIKVFGPEWAKLTEEQRQQVTQGIINAGLYDSKKGDVIITDEEKARAIKDSVLGKQAAPQGQPAIPRPIANAEQKALENWK